MKFMIKMLALLLMLNLFAGVALVQEDSPITLIQAIETVRAEYGEDVVIVSIELEDDDLDQLVWAFEIRLSDGTSQYVMIGINDGSITEGMPPADDDSLDDSNDNSDDSNDNSDDSDDNSNDSDDNSNDNSDDSSDDNSDDSFDEAQLASVTITAEQAIELARQIFPTLEFDSIELEDYDDGNLVWDIEFESGRSVDVDASTGNILSFGYETSDDNSYDDDRSDDSNDNDSSDDRDDNDDSDDNDNSDDDDDSDDNDDRDDDRSDDSDDDSNDDRDDDDDDDNDNSNDDDDDDDDDDSDDDDDDDSDDD